MINCVCDYCRTECDNYMTIENRAKIDSQFCSYDCAIQAFCLEFKSNWNEKAFNEWLDLIITKMKKIQKYDLSDEITEDEQ